MLELMDNVFKEIDIRLTYTKYTIYSWNIYSTNRPNEISLILGFIDQTFRGVPPNDKRIISLQLNLNKDNIKFIHQQISQYLNKG